MIYSIFQRGSGKKISRLRKKARKKEIRYQAEVMKNFDGKRTNQSINLFVYKRKKEEEEEKQRG